MPPSEPQHSNTPAPKPRGDHGCLYVAIAVFVVLGCLVVFVSQLAMKEMRKIQAQMTASDLRSAVMMYQTEYKQFPVPQTGSDAVVDTSAPSGIISLLVGDDKRKPFFSDKAARNPTKAGIYRSGDGAQLKDPWGNFYLIYMDTDGDGEIEITYPDRKGMVTGVVATRSLGPNRVIDHTSGSENDDIFAH